jgi:hypothetical protein
MNVTTKTKTQKLTDALIADRDRTDNATHNIVSCWSCGHRLSTRARAAT